MPYFSRKLAIMKFLWLDINASYSHSSLAFPALEAQLSPESRNRCQWEMVSGTTKSPPLQIISQILHSSPNYIFATGWLFNIEYILSVLTKVHALNNKIQIVLGGPEFLGDNKKFLTINRFITAVFKGEAEEVFPEFIQNLLNQPDSLSWRELPGFEYIQNSPSNGAEKFISKSPVHVLDFLSLAAPETSRFFNWDKAFVQLETSRGCFNSCRFCVSGIDHSPIQNIPVQAIRERLKYISENGIREVRILDRTFNASPKRAVELLDLFEEFAGKIQFHIEIHPALLNDTVKAKLSTITDNLLHVEAGIQSMDNQVLQQSARAGSSEEALEGLQFLLSLKKFEVHTDFIAGLPGYPFSGVLDDINRMIAISPGEIQLELLKLLPGTCFREQSQYGIIYSPLPPYEVLQTAHITYGQLSNCLVLSKILEYWYNNPCWREVFKKIVIRESGFLNAITDYLSKTDFLHCTHSAESRALLLFAFCKQFYPTLLFDISLGWILNGFSVKKEPAMALRHWNSQKAEITNPVFEKGNTFNSYYYLNGEKSRYWFVYNKQIDRNKPVVFFEEKR